MTDEFEFTLHSPLTKEDWNKLSDAEHENTMFVTFQTPQGRQVRYIKCEVLDKIKAEIEDRPSYMLSTSSEYERGVNAMLSQALMIIDKYKTEKE